MNTHQLHDESQLLTTEQVSRYLGGVPEKTLANWRYRGVIPYVKVGGLVRYIRSDIDAWISRLKRRA